MIYKTNTLYFKEGGANAMSGNQVVLYAPLIFNSTIDEGCFKTIIYNGQKMTVDMCKINGECRH